MGIDRRKYTRISVMIADIIGESKGQTLKFEKTRNISRGGLFIQTEHPLPLGQTFTLDFFLSEIKTHVRCRAEVMWSRPPSPSETRESGMGIRFLDLDEAIRNKIDEWISTTYNDENK